jgi:hypothetical protein
MIKNNHKKLYTLIKLFNSDIGLVAKIIGDISIYIQLLELYPSTIIPLDEIKFALQNNIKYYLSSIFRIKIRNSLFKQLDKICSLNNNKKVVQLLTKFNDDFKKLLEDEAKVWISFNKSIIPT